VSASQPIASKIEVEVFVETVRCSLKRCCATRAATVAGAFGGLLAYGIEHMEGLGGLHGWAWIVGLFY